MNASDPTADVVVIGAGFCGLSAARSLVDAGHDVVVLEARASVGGRVRSQLNGLGERVDTGGQFLCDDMPELLALLRRFDKTLVLSPVDGRFLTQPPMSDAEAGRVYSCSMAIRDRMQRLDPFDPAIAGLSVAGWLDRQGDDEESKAAFRSMIEGLWCLALDRLPLWHLVDNDRRITNQMSELQCFPAETMHALAEDLARELGDRVRLDTAATGVSHGPDGVRVATVDRMIPARAVIVAVPPVMASRLAYQPPLPPRLRGALSAWESGAVVKALIRYDRPFWRARGLSGMVAWREPSSLFAFDASSDTAHAMLAFFIGGPLAVAMRALGEAAVRAQILARLSTALGPEAAMPLDVMLLDWTHDAWSGGAYSDLVVDMDATDAEDMLRRGLPGLVFAASELSPSFPGYIEGAIVAGRAAAARVVDGFGAS